MTATRVCMLCNEAISTSGDSREHLIPNAVGGRRRVSGVLCKRCNNGAGHKWDSELARQLNPLSVFFNISRDRGRVPSQLIQTVDAGPVEMHADGTMLLARPSLDRRPTDDGRVSFSMVARTPAEARRMLAGLAKKHPSIDVEALLANAETQMLYPTAVGMPLQVGGGDADRSIVKSGMVLAASLGVEPRDCVDGLSFLHCDDGENHCLQFFYERDVLLNRPTTTPIHCVAVSNRETEGQLLAYVEYYGIFRWVIRLATRYDGPDIHASYGLDPVSGQQVELQMDLQLKRQQMDDLLESTYFDSEAVRNAFANVVPPILAQKRKRQFDQVLSEACDYAWKNCAVQTGESLTESHIDQWHRLFMHYITPYLVRRLTPVAQEQG